MQQFIAVYAVIDDRGAFVQAVQHRDEPEELRKCTTAECAHVSVFDNENDAILAATAMAVKAAAMHDRKCAAQCWALMFVVNRPVGIVAEATERTPAQWAEILNNTANGVYPVAIDPAVIAAELKKGTH